MYKPLNLTPEEFEGLRGQLLNCPAVMPMQSDPKFTALVAAVGVQQEIGTINDEFARFFYDADTGDGILKSRIKSELIEYRGYAGVRIWVEGKSKIDLRLNGIRELVHPSFSFNLDGTIRQCIFFPESIVKIAKLQGVELVLVREWALNTIFGGFDRNKLFYETNTWELVQNDALRYSSLLEKGQIAFLGTHDLSAHIVGILREPIDELRTFGREAYSKFNRYFGGMEKPSIYSLVIPYAAGVILDDLAQPRNYGSPGRRFVLESLLNALDQKLIDPARPRILIRFPDSYEKLIRIARDPDPDPERIKSKAPRFIHEMITELRINSI